MSLNEGKFVILVAEDEAVVRRVVQAALTHAGYEVLTAMDGAEALQVSRGYTGTIHLLLTDVCMPNVQGPELARQIAIERPGIRILMMTGTSGVVTEHLPPKLLHKPFRPGHLIDEIAALLSES
jgi:two-component system, cell cycle sensor histidine kinase and response regulator CckA